MSDDAEYPYIAERHMPTVYSRHEVPDDLDTSGALAYARELAVDRGARVCLVHGPRGALYLAADGTVETWSGRPPEGLDMSEMWRRSRESE